MTDQTNPTPTGYPTVCPYLVVRDVSALIEFTKKVFDAQEIERTKRPDGSIMHAEVRIGNSIVMMGQATGNIDPMPAMLYLYLDDTDSAYQRALAAGATTVREPVDEPYGDRVAGVQDSNGNQWWMATHQEDVSSEEIERRMADRARQ